MFKEWIKAMYKELKKLWAGFYHQVETINKEI